MHTYYALVLTVAASTIFTPAFIGIRSRTNALGARSRNNR